MDKEELNTKLLQSITASIDEIQHMNYGNAMQILMQAELCAEGIDCKKDIAETVYQ